MNWLRYSGIWITFILNPLHWQICFHTETTPLSPKLTEYSLQIAFISIKFVVDDGSW